MPLWSKALGEDVLLRPRINWYRAGAHLDHAASACPSTRLGTLAGVVGRHALLRARAQRQATLPLSVRHGDTDPADRFEHVVIVKHLERFAKEQQLDCGFGRPGTKALRH